VRTIATAFVRDDIKRGDGFQQILLMLFTQTPFVPKKFVLYLFLTNPA